jgi:N-acylneuraminate cytidylyltransferase
LNYAVCAISRENMIQLKNIIGIHPYFFNIDEMESIDVDTEIDFDFAEFMYKKFRM